MHAMAAIRGSLAILTIPVSHVTSLVWQHTNIPMIHAQSLQFNNISTNTRWMSDTRRSRAEVRSVGGQSFGHMLGCAGDFGFSAVGEGAMLGSMFSAGDNSSQSIIDVDLCAGEGEARREPVNFDFFFDITVRVSSACHHNWNSLRTPTNYEICSALQLLQGSLVQAGFLCKIG
jgi:hypothetical protein